MDGGARRPGDDLETSRLTEPEARLRPAGIVARAKVLVDVSGPPLRAVTTTVDGSPTATIAGETAAVTVRLARARTTARAVENAEVSPAGSVAVAAKHSPSEPSPRGKAAWPAASVWTVRAGVTGTEEPGPGYWEMSTSW